MAKKKREISPVDKLEVHRDGKAVIAGHIDVVNINPQPEISATLLDPFASVPPLPIPFVNRPALTRPVIEKLHSPSGMVGLIALEGMGGVGKTMVALAICHEQSIRTRFPDGIVWVNVGKEAKLTKEDRIGRVTNALNLRFDAYTEDAYRTLFSNKSVLVVLDDVWNTKVIEPLLIPPGRSRLLYTSRDRGLAGPLGADNYDVGILDDRQARHFLAVWSGREKTTLPEPITTKILGECKGLALALAMIGAVLKGQRDQRWKYLLDDLRQARNLRKVGVRPSGYQHEDLHAAIAVSVNALAPESKSKYLRLAPLLEDMTAAKALLHSLWGGGEREIDDLICLFVGRSLASRDAEDGIRIHDLQLDYARGENTDPAGLLLQHRALLRSLHIVRPHPEQFASQMTGRLLAHQSQPGVAALLQVLDSCSSRPRLRPLRPTLEPADGPTERVLEGNTGEIVAVALSADGRRVVSGSNDGKLSVWDLDGQQQPRVLEGHRGPVGAVALSADGKRAVSGSDDGTLRVWDLEGEQQPLVLKSCTAIVVQLALSADGKRAVSGSYEQTLRVWDLESQQQPGILEGHTDLVLEVAMSADGKRVVSFGDDTLRVWDLESKQMRVLRTGFAAPLALSADGGRAVFGSHDETLRVWDLESQQQPRVLEGRAESVLR